MEGQIHVLQPDFLIYSSWSGSEPQTEMHKREKKEKGLGMRRYLGKCKKNSHAETF